MKTTISNDVLSAAVAAVRSQRPLVHNITNYVVMNNSANALLAVGASPVMAPWTQEMEEMVGIANALVLNIGTLDENWLESMKVAGVAASRRGIPIVLDPVGAGATRARPRRISSPFSASLTSILHRRFRRSAYILVKPGGMCCTIIIPGMSLGSRFITSNVASVPPVEAPRPMITLLRASELFREVIAGAAAAAGAAALTRAERT